jgi:hypothetical protein
MNWWQGETVGQDELTILPPRIWRLKQSSAGVQDLDLG